jgi:phage/plasmid-associated DNA primase
MPKDFCLKSTNYDFHSENKEKVKDVNEFFEDIFVEKELIQYVLKILVSSLTFINKLSTIVLFIGSGSNGRTTLTNMIHFLIRDYAATSNECFFIFMKIGQY